MFYLQAENLKHKRTFTKTLIILAPIVTALMNIFAPLWFQINSYNWWYILLYPGFLTLICTLVEQRDNSKLKYRAVFSLPISLGKVWKGKIGIVSIYAFVGNLVFLILNLLGGFAMLAVYKVPLTVGVVQAVAGTACIILTSLWQIPLCLWLSRKVGIFLTVVLNAGLGSVLAIFMATTSLWIVCPYSWAPHLMISVLNILPNGEPVTEQVTVMSFPMIIFTVVISLALYVFLSIYTAKCFEQREVE